MISIIIPLVSAADYGTKTYTKDYSLPKNGQTSSTSVINISPLSGQQQQQSQPSNIGGQTTNYYQQQSQPLQPIQPISPSSLLAGPLYKMPATSTSISTSTSSESNVIQAAVQSKHEIQFRDYPTTGNIVPTIVEVGAISVPLHILFKSASSSLKIHQAHEGSEGSIQETESEDEPHRLVHRLKKPIYQEVHELITPFRKVSFSYKFENLNIY